MNRTVRMLLLTLAIVIVASFVLVKLFYPGKPPVRLSAEKCDATLWKRVYAPGRLHMIEPCTAVEGRVAGVAREDDGDLHIAIDPDVKAALNVFNVVHARGWLIVEAVCDHAPAHNDKAVAACAGFTSQIVAPGIGQRIRVIGSYVTDTDIGWNEIHPLTRIEPLQ